MVLIITGYVSLVLTVVQLMIALMQLKAMVKRKKHSSRRHHHRRKR